MSLPNAPDLGALCDRATAFHDGARGRITALGDRVRAHGDDPRLLAPWNHFEREVITHFDEEERVLFPALRALALGDPPEDGPWRTHLHELSRELDEVRTIADALRDAARDAGDLELDLLDLLDDLETHADAEANIILPAARAVLLEATAEVVEPLSREPASEPARAEALKVGGRMRRLARRLRDVVRRRS